MAREIPEVVRAAAGLAATVLDEARKLPETLPGLPVRLIGMAMQQAMKVQQHYAGLVARGDELFTGLRGEDEPGLATFDDDDEPAAPPAGFRESAFDRAAGDAEAASADVDLILDDEVATAEKAPDTEEILEEIAIDELVDQAPTLEEADPGAAAPAKKAVRKAAKKTTAKKAVAKKEVAKKAAPAETPAAQPAPAPQPADSPTATDTLDAEPTADVATTVDVLTPAGDVTSVEATVTDEGVAAPESAPAPESGPAPESSAAPAPSTGTTADTSSDAGTSTAPSTDGAANASTAPRTPPIDGYDAFTVAQLRGRLRGYALTTVQELIDYEQATRDRAPYLTMLRNRLEKLEEQAIESSPLAPRGA
jgi:hypothetical protein